MNVQDADERLTEAVAQRDEAARFLARFTTDVEQAESALFVARSNRDAAQRHYDQADARVSLCERVLREATIANDGGYHPKGGM